MLGAKLWLLFQIQGCKWKLSSSLFDCHPQRLKCILLPQTRVQVGWKVGLLAAKPWVSSLELLTNSRIWQLSQTYHKNRFNHGTYNSFQINTSLQGLFILKHFYCAAAWMPHNFSMWDGHLVSEYNRIQNV